jgi:ABC-type enterochelin transport system permease subunit
MGGILAGLTTVLQAVATALVGPFGVLLVTVGLAGTAVSVLWFHVPMHYLWKAALVSVILLGAGAIAQALVTA